MKCVYIDLVLNGVWNGAVQDPGDAWKYAELEGLIEYLKAAAAAAGRFVPDPRIPFTAEPSRELYLKLSGDYCV